MMTQTVVGGVSRVSFAVPEGLLTFRTRTHVPLNVHR